MKGREMKNEAQVAGQLSEWQNYLLSDGGMDLAPCWLVSKKPS